MEDDALIFDSLERLGAAGRHTPRRAVPERRLSRPAGAHGPAAASYDPEAYRVRGWAMPNEARRLGIPIVAPADCALALAGLR